MRKKYEKNTKKYNLYFKCKAPNEEICSKLGITWKAYFIIKI